MPGTADPPTTQTVNALEVIGLADEPVHLPRRDESRTVSVTVLRDKKRVLHFEF